MDDNRILMLLWQRSEEIIDFVLDRPFLFVITKNSIPLFAGVVNEP